MSVVVHLPRSNEKKRIFIEKPTSILDILRQLDIKPDTCITLKNKNPVPIDDIVTDGETIELIEVTSGG